MWNLEEFQVLTEVGEVFEHLHDAAIVGLEKGLEGEDGEQLMLGEVLAASS